MAGKFSSSITSWITPWVAPWVALLAVGTGCGNSNLPDYVRMGGLRVLALKANLPEVAPGAAVTVTPVVSDLSSGRTLSYVAKGCVDPGVGLGASPTCDGIPGATTIASGAVTPALAAPNYTGPAPVLSFSVPSTMLSGRSPIDQANGVAYLVMYELTATSASGATQTLKTFKRIIVSTRTGANTNPSITGVTAGATGLQAFVTGITYPAPASEVVLSVQTSAASTQSYTALANDGTARALTETLTTTWFLSDGDVKYFRTSGSDANIWYPPNTRPTGHTPTFVVVVRDGRGGEDFLVAQ